MTFEQQIGFRSWLASIAGPAEPVPGSLFHPELQPLLDFLCAPNSAAQVSSMHQSGPERSEEAACALSITALQVTIQPRDVQMAYQSQQEALNMGLPAEI